MHNTYTSPEPYTFNAKQERVFVDDPTVGWETLRGMFQLSISDRHEPQEFLFPDFTLELNVLRPKGNNPSAHVLVCDGKHNYKIADNASSAASYVIGRLTQKYS